MAGMERSARFYLGGVEARFMDSLNRTLPSDASVVVPEQALQFSQQSILTVVPAASKDHRLWLWDKPFGRNVDRLREMHAK